MVCPSKKYVNIFIRHPLLFNGLLIFPHIRLAFFAGWLLCFVFFFSWFYFHL